MMRYQVAKVWKPRSAISRTTPISACGNGRRAVNCTSRLPYQRLPCAWTGYRMWAAEYDRKMCFSVQLRNIENMGVVIG